MSHDVPQATTSPPRAREPAPRWMSRVLLAAAAYNIAWGAFTILFPGALFRWVGADAPNYPALWQCIGMIVGVYGVGYAIAARDPVRHWPIVLVGLLGKILGPIGFVDAALVRGTMPVGFGFTILTNDLVWWVPFAGILLHAARADMAPPIGEPVPLDVALARARTSTGESLLDLTSRRDTLVVLLRHAGCTFCREALHDLARQREDLHARGIGLVIVTMSPEPRAGQVLSGYGLGQTPRVSDPDAELYRAFALRRASVGELFRPGLWWRALVAGGLRGHGVGRLEGDGFQMPGAFLLRGPRVLRAYRHATSADRPDYTALACAGEPEGAASPPPPAPRDSGIHAAGA